MSTFEERHGVSREQLRALVAERARAGLPLGSRARRRALQAARAEGVPLTRRQRQVLLLIADGLTSGEIAARLVVQPGTAKSHTRDLLARLGARSRAHAVAVAFRRGLIE